MTSKYALMVGAALAVLGATPALGRTAAADDNMLDEIVVTAQKRAENLQDVPISIAVLRGDQLDASSAPGVTEALSRVPGLSINIPGQTGGTQISMRGVTAGGPLFTGSSTVGYYLDSVPFALVRSAIVPDPAAYDLARVEVLRGPQGTLYGASALNGVVRVLTQSADLNEFEGKARAAVSSTRYAGDLNYRGDAALNVPIIEDKFAARAVLGYQTMGGWISAGPRKDANDFEALNARLRLDAQPTERLTLSGTVWVSRVDQGAINAANEDRIYTNRLAEPISTDFETYGLSANYDFPLFTLTSMTSYIDYDTTSFIDLRSYAIPDNRLETSLASEVFSQEVVLNSAGDGPWRWSVGGIYRDAKDHVFQTRPSRIVNGRIAPISWQDKSESYALFGQVTRMLLDERLELSAGLRYFEDKVSLRELLKIDNSANPLFFRQTTFTATTPRVAATWHARKDWTIYASYSEGFRSGFDQNPIVLVAAPLLGPVEADRLHNYEIGSKGAVLDGLLTFDASLYYIDWTDVQQQLGIVAFGNSVAAAVNGVSASGVGVDFSATLRPAEGFSIGGSLGWNDLRLDEDIFNATTATSIRLFEKGERLTDSPEWTIAGYADYTFDLPNELVGTLSGSVNYTSERSTRAIVSGVSTRFSGDSLLFGRVSFAVESPDRWTATLFIDNVTNEQGTITARPNVSPEGFVRPRPRTVGVQLEAPF